MVLWWLLFALFLILVTSSTGVGRNLYCPCIVWTGWSLLDPFVLWNQQCEMMAAIHWLMVTLWLQRFQDVEENHLQQMRTFVDAYMSSWNNCCVSFIEVRSVSTSFFFLSFISVSVLSAHAVCVMDRSVSLKFDDDTIQAYIDRISQH